MIGRGGPEFVVVILILTFGVDRWASAGVENPEVHPTRLPSAAVAPPYALATVSASGQALCLIESTQVSVYDTRSWKLTLVVEHGREVESAVILEDALCVSDYFDCAAYDPRSGKRMWSLPLPQEGLRLQRVGRDIYLTRKSKDPWHYRIDAKTGKLDPEHQGARYLLAVPGLRHPLTLDPATGHLLRGGTKLAQLGKDAHLLTVDSPEPVVAWQEGTAVYVLKPEEGSVAVVSRRMESALETCYSDDQVSIWFGRPTSFSAPIPISQMKDGALDKDQVRSGLPPSVVRILALEGRTLLTHESVPWEGGFRDVVRARDRDGQVLWSHQLEQQEVLSGLTKIAPNTFAETRCGWQGFTVAVVDSAVGTRKPVAEGKNYLFDPKRRELVEADRERRLRASVRKMRSQLTEDAGEESRLQAIFHIRLHGTVQDMKELVVFLDDANTTIRIAVRSALEARFPEALKRRLETRQEWESFLDERIAHGSEAVGK